PWQGNVRELRHALERACVFAGAGQIEVAHLGHTPPSAAAPPTIRDAAPGPSSAVASPTLREGMPPPAPGKLPAEVAALERGRIEDALASTRGNQSKAAKLLGISRGVLIAKIEAFGLPRPRKR